MNRTLYHLQKYNWHIYLSLIALYFFIKGRLLGTGQIYYEVYKDSVTDNKVMNLYILVFCILLLYFYKKISRYDYVLRYRHLDRYLIYVLKNILYRSISFSFVLNIIFFLFVGPSAKKGLTGGNFTRVLLMFFTQTIGWIFLGIFIFISFLLFKKMIYSFAMCYIIALFLNYAYFVRFYSRFQLYIRMYYFMFRTEVFPSVHLLLSSVSLFAMLDFLGILLAQKLLSRHEYL